MSFAKVSTIQLALVSCNSNPVKEKIKRTLTQDNHWQLRSLVK
jgi:hypothetical protein